MVGEYPLLPILKSTPSGLNTKLSRSEILSVSSFLSSFSFYFFIWLLNFAYLFIYTFIFFLYSVLIPTEPRFSDSSFSTILQQLQPQRSNLVYEQWKLSVQCNFWGTILLHQWRTRKLRKETEVLHYRWECNYCIFSFIWSQCIARDFTFLSKCFWLNPTSFLFTINEFPSFHGFCYWICGMCITRWHYVKNIINIQKPNWEFFFFFILLLIFFPPPLLDSKKYNWFTWRFLVLYFVFFQQLYAIHV